MLANRAAIGEIVMRYYSLAAAAALALMTISTALHGQRPDDQIDPRSLQLLATARTAQAAGDLDSATDSLETALAVDPRNRAAFVLLGDVANARGLSGKAIRYYREALALEPNDLAALKGQGEALLAKGAIERARLNLARIRKLCAKGCAEATQLAAAITRAAPPPAIAAQTAKSAKE